MVWESAVSVFVLASLRTLASFSSSKRCSAAWLCDFVPLLYGNTLGKVTWVVRVVSFSNRQIVREELERDSVNDR